MLHAIQVVIGTIFFVVGVGVLLLYAYAIFRLGKDTVRDLKEEKQTKIKRQEELEAWYRENFPARADPRSFKTDPDDVPIRPSSVECRVREQLRDKKVSDSLY